MSVWCSGGGGPLEGRGHRFEPREPRSVATLHEKIRDLCVAGRWGSSTKIHSACCDLFAGAGGHPPAQIAISLGTRLRADGTEAF